MRAKKILQGGKMNNKKFYTCSNDSVFKEIFMREENKDLLIALLESILDIKIKEIKYLNLEKNVDNINVRRKRFDLHIKTDKENIQIEVNSQMHDYIRPRNASFLFDTYSHNVVVGGDYSEKTLFIQINFTYGLGEDTKYNNKKEYDVINKYMFMNEKCKPYIHNIVLYEFDMDYFTKLWYSKDEKEKERYKYLMMMNLGIDELKKLSHKDRKVGKYMSELERVNEDPDFRDFITYEEDRKKIENSLKREYKEKGLEEGRAEGITEERINNAKKMKEENISIELISKITGLSEEEINTL